MSIRKAIKIKESLFVCIPSGVCEVLGIEKGDRLSVDYFVGVGILVRKNYPGMEIPVQIGRLDSMKAFMDKVEGEFRRKVRSIQRSAVNNIWLESLGVAHEKGRVDELHFSDGPYQAPIGVLSDLFPGEEKKMISARSQTKSNTESQTRSNTRSRTESQTESKKKSGGVQKAHRRKGGLVNGGRR